MTSVGVYNYQLFYTDSLQLLTISSFIGNSTTLGQFSDAIQKIKDPRGIDLLEKIEHSINHMSNIYYNFACAYSLYDIREKSLYYLELDLHSKQGQSIEKL